jgi:hypothetical protein
MAEAAAVVIIFDEYAWPLNSTMGSNADTPELSVIIKSIMSAKAAEQDRIIFFARCGMCGSRRLKRGEVAEEGACFGAV